MRQLRHDIQAYRLVASIFLACWVVLWIISAATWLYDPAGYSAGMRMEVFWVHLLAPLVAGTLAGWWQDGIRGSIKNGLLGGLFYSVMDFVVLLVWSGILMALGRVDPGALEAMPWWEGALEALEMGLANVILGLVLGGVGGTIGGLVTATRRRLQRATV